jgi:hypothetical protein
LNSKWNSIIILKWIEKWFEKILIGKYFFENKWIKIFKLYVQFNFLKTIKTIILQQQQQQQQQH